MNAGTANRNPSPGWERGRGEGRTENPLLATVTAAAESAE
jgi:hypothetical protein